MKVIIQIPCYNEEATLPGTLADLPRELPGVDSVEWLVVDDGSDDRTAEIAESLGVDHIERHIVNKGLARAFQTGLRACLFHGADIIVNTDGDNQYCGADIEKLIEPVVRGEADMVIGERPIGYNEGFSRTKRVLQRVGSWVVRRISGTSVKDAPSGFRAISRNAAYQLNVFNPHTYTLETIIQAGHKGLAVVSVPIRTNPVQRPSRLVHSIPDYVIRSTVTMVRIYMTYKPFYFFTLPGVASMLFGILIGARFLYFFFTGSGEGHIQSLILCAIAIAGGLGLVLVGLLADLISVNRKLLEKIDGQLTILEDRDRESPN